MNKPAPVAMATHRHSPVLRQVPLTAMDKKDKGCELLSDTGDVVARWTVPLHDKIHKIEFEHGTTTGKRIIRVDGVEIVKKDWMFKLVGKETFTIAKNVKCVITAESINTFQYEYSLEVNGKKFEKFREEQSKRLQCWEIHVSGEEVRVVLDKDTMDVWVNGHKIHTAGEFIEDGTETHFEIMGHPSKIKSVSSGKKKLGIVHLLFVDGQQQNSEASSVDYRLTETK